MQKRKEGWRNAGVDCYCLEYALCLAALSAALLEVLLVLPLEPHCRSTAAKSLSSMSWPPMLLPVVTSFVHCSVFLPEALK